MFLEAKCNKSILVSQMLMPAVDLLVLLLQLIVGSEAKSFHYPVNINTRLLSSSLPVEFIYSTMALITIDIVACYQSLFIDSPIR